MLHFWKFNKFKLPWLRDMEKEMGRVWNRELVVNYCKMLEEMHLPRRTWLTVNRIRKLQDRYGGHLLHKWKYRNYPSCDCGETEPVMDHIVTECPKRLFFIKASLVFIIRYSGSYRMDQITRHRLISLYKL